MNENARTEHLYYDDPCLIEFEAGIIESTEYEGKPAVILDRTAFYPESGGQPWDTGELNGVKVVQVVENEGDVIHVLERKLEDGGPVRGRVDWPRRFDHMQQHTGQHILSQAFWEFLKGETRSFHLGDALTTLEIGLPSISDADLERVEARANAVVWEDLEVKAYFVPEESVKNIPLRRPPKKHGLLRIIEVAGYDYSACGGTHCPRTGRVGIIKILGAEKIRGNLRFEFVCGGRALRDYALKNAEMKAVAGMFSSSAGRASAAVGKLADEAKQVKKRVRELAEKLAAYEAADLLAKAGGSRIVAGVLEGKGRDEARSLALELSRLGPVCALFAVQADGQGYLVCARHASLDADLRGLVPAVKASVEVKGGGGPSLVELVVPDGNAAGLAFAAARAWLETAFKG